MPLEGGGSWPWHFQPWTLNTRVTTWSPVWWLRGRTLWTTLIIYSWLFATSDVSKGVLTGLLINQK